MNYITTLSNHACASRFLFRACIATLVFLLSSCNESDNSPVSIEHFGEPIEINIIPEGIAFFGQSTRAVARRSSDRTNRVYFLEDFDDENMLETIIEATPEVIETPTRATNLTNTTMRVVACDASGNIKGQCVYNVTDGTATAQTDQSLVLPYSTSNYTFHCYSPANAIDTSTKKVTINKSDNFAYAKSTTKITPSANATASVSIPLLQPMMSKLKLSVTSQAGHYTGNATCTGTVKGTFGTSATWSLGSSSLSVTSAANQSISFSANNEEQLVYSGNATGNLSLSLASLKFGSTSLSSPTLNAANGFTLEAGKLYTISITIKKKLYISNTDLGLKVAKGNLVYKSGTWQLAPDQGWYSGTKDGGDYFNWGLTNPLTYGDTSSSYYGANMTSLTTACVSVLGTGWRIPSRDDMSKLGSTPNSVWSTYSSARGTVYGYYWGTKDETTAKNNKDSYVFIPAAGFRSDSGSIGNTDDRGSYWSSSSSTSNTAYYLLFDKSGVRSGNSQSARYLGRSLRCVANL